MPPKLPSLSRNRKSPSEFIWFYLNSLISFNSPSSPSKSISTSVGHSEFVENSFSQQSSLSQFKCNEADRRELFPLDEQDELGDRELRFLGDFGGVSHSGNCSGNGLAGEWHRFEGIREAEVKLLNPLRKKGEEI
jgi:hypothetical protein